jgi:hypothetical protein
LWPSASQQAELLNPLNQRFPWRHLLCLDTRLP